MTSALLFSAACANLQLPIPSGGPSNGGGTASGTVPSGSSAVAAQVVSYTNDARTRNGLPAFNASPRLMEAARIQAEQMASFQRAEHNLPGAQYPTLESRLKAVGYVYSSAAENVAWNQTSAQSAVNSWMNSSGHRANILDPSLREIGTAMVRSPKGEPYWIQVFGTPR